MKKREGKGLTFCHSVQHHVNEDVSTSPPCSIAEMKCMGHGVGVQKIRVGLEMHVQVRDLRVEIRGQRFK